MVLYGRIDGPGFSLEEELDTLYARPIAEWTVDRFFELQHYDD